MNDKIYQEIPEHLRERELTDQATKVEHGKYQRWFTEKERAEKDKEYRKRSAELFRLREQKKKVISEMNNNLKKQTAELIQMLQIADNGFTNEEGKLFLFDDQEAGDMHIYNAQGILVEKRMLLPEERQFLTFRRDAVGE